MVFEKKDLENLKKLLPELPQQKREKFTKTFGISTETAWVLTESKELALYFEQAVKLGEVLKIEAATIANVIKNKKYDWQKLSPEELITKLKQESSDKVSDEGALGKIIDEILKNNPKVVEDYKAGKVQVLGFLVGQVMRQTQGKADAEISNKVLRQKLK